MDPYATWPAIGTPPVTTSAITKIYGVVRGSRNTNIGDIHSPTVGDYLFSQSDPVPPSGEYIQYTFLAGPGGVDPTTFPWTSFDLFMGAPSSLDEYWTPPMVFSTSDIGFLIYGVTKVTTPNIVVIGWVDASAITLPTGESTALQLALVRYSPVCTATLLAWSQNNTLDLLGTTANKNYANAWLLKNSGNTAPPATIDPATVLGGGDFRLFNESQWTFFQSNGILSSATQITRTAAVGATPDPCGFAPAPVPGQNHPDNGASGITASADAVYQLAEGRIGTTGQAVSQTINGRTVPWIWSVIKFDTSGVATTTD